MTVRRLVTACVLVAIAAIAAMALHRYRLEVTSTRLQRLLEETLQSGTGEPFETRGETRVLVGQSWEQTPMTTKQAGVRALIALGVSGRESRLLDDGDRLWRLSGAGSPAPVGSSVRRVDWALLQANYEVRPARYREVAGLPTRGLQLVSQHTGRCAEVFWIEPEARLVLGRETHDADGHLVSASEVTKFELAPSGSIEREIEQAVSRLPAPTSELSLTDAEFASRAGFTPVRPQYLPKGYQELALYARTCPHGRVYAELVYFDGLRVMSVFEHPGGGPGGGGGWGQGRGWKGGRGQAMASEPVIVDEGQAKTVRARRGGRRVFVTADLTQQEILRVVNSIP